MSVGGILAAGLQHTVPRYFPLALILVLSLGSLCVALPLRGAKGAENWRDGGKQVFKEISRGNWTGSKSDSHREIKINVKQKCNENDTLFPRVRLNW